MTSQMKLTPRWMAKKEHAQIYKKNQVIIRGTNCMKVYRGAVQRDDVNGGEDFSAYFL